MLANVNKPLKPLRFTTFFLSRLVPLDLAFQYIKELAEQRFKLSNEARKIKGNFQKTVVITDSFKTGSPKRYSLELPTPNMFRDYTERTNIDKNKPIITYALYRWDGLIVSRMLAVQLYRINLQHKIASISKGIDGELHRYFTILKTKTPRATIKVSRAIAFLSFRLSELFWHFEQDDSPILKYRAREVKGTDNIDFEDIPIMDEIVNQLYLLDNDELNLVAGNVSISFAKRDETLFEPEDEDEDSNESIDISDIMPAYTVYINDTFLLRMLVYIEGIVKNGELENAEPAQF